MRTRILVAVVAIPLLLLLIFFAPLWAFAIFVGVVSAGAAWEFLRCVAPNSPVRFRVYAAVTGVIITAVRPAVTHLLYNHEEIFVFAYLGLPAALTFLLTLIMFCEIVISYRNENPIKLETLLYVLFAGAVMPLLLSALVRIGQRPNASVYLLLPFVAAFSSDSGGYFAGKFFGKKKAFPHLSPNKTVEGCIGGLVCAVVIMLLYGLVLSTQGFAVSYPALVLYGLLGSVACQIGDLAFSAVKRQYGIKDYGTLIPGHGGMLDRFDSMHFTAPMIELLVLFLPAISR